MNKIINNVFAILFTLTLCVIIIGAVSYIPAQCGIKGYVQTKSYVQVKRSLAPDMWVRKGSVDIIMGSRIKVQNGWIDTQHSEKELLDMFGPTK